MNEVFRRFLRAISYVTAIPCPLKEELNASEWQTEFAGLAKYLPLVGVLIGGTLCAFVWILQATHVNQLLAGLIITIVWLCITGGFHLDGLMDTADGLFSHRDKDRMLEIMSDSRVGNYAVMAAICLFFIKVICLATLPKEVLLPIIFIIPNWSRWCSTYAMGKFIYLRKEGKGKIFHDSMKFPQDLWIGLAPCLVASLLAYFYNPYGAIIASIGSIVFGLTSAHWIDRHLGGHTGDTYGAVVELAEAGSLLFASWLLLFAQ